MSRFIDQLQKRCNKGFFLCVGLDTDYKLLPEAIRTNSITESLFNFNREIIDATAGFCCSFKPNSAFYEGYGPEGFAALIKTNLYIREHYPEHLVILDAKRADIGNTNRGYVKAAFEIGGAHAITVHPYLGKEALQPFLEDEEFGLFVLCHTSNPGAGEFQELEIQGRKLYKIVAERVATDWNVKDNCGLVVGATYPQQMAEVRQVAGELPLLIPGIGAQGGDLDATVKNGLTRNGRGIIINASRSIIYASSGSNFATAAAQEAKLLDDAIREIIKKVTK